MKKFLKIALLAMSVVMLLSVCVGAEGTIKFDEPFLWIDGEPGECTATVIDGENTIKSITWTAAGDAVSVDKDGNITALKVGTGDIVALYSYDVEVPGEGEKAPTVETKKDSAYASIEVKQNTLTGIDVTVKSTFVDKQVFKTSDFEVKGTYADGKPKTLASFEISPAAATMAKKEVTISVGGLTKTVPIDVKEIHMEDLVKSIKISEPKTNQEYKVGDKITKSDVVIEVTDIDNKISYVRADSSDVTCSLFEGASSYTFSNEDAKAGSKTITVTYAEKPASVTVKVTAATPAAKSYTVTVTTQPTKTAYNVGDTFDHTGMKVTVKDEKGNAVTATGLTISPYKFTTSDVGKTSFKFTLSFNADGASYEKEITVSGLTVKAAATKLDFYEITDVELAEEKYPVGYKFSLDDISRIYIKEKRTSTKTTSVKGSDLDQFSNSFDLQVLDAKGKSKSSKYDHLLEEDDVTTNSSGKEIVNMVLIIDDEEYEFTVLVGESGIGFYYDGELIKGYDDLEDALDATIEQDKDVNTKDFDLDDVSDKKYILIKLGEDYEISSRYEFDPEHNIVIDLNGHDLTFYTDTIEISKANKDYTVTIKNSSKTAAKFIYDDKTNGEVTLEQNGTLTFKYDGDLPGFYTLTIKAGTNGSILVKGNTKAVTSLEVAHGSDVTLTVTPDKGYQIDTVKYDGKTLTTTSQTIPYTVSKDGVATVTLKGIAKSAALEATFKKAEEEKKEETTKKWNNPFTDITDRSQYYSAVEFVCTNELFNGVSATKFAPENTMTRAMFVTVLGRLAAKTQNIDFTQYTASSFTDVSASNPQNGYAAPYIEWASRVGIVEGYGDGTFGPNNNITHQQMYLMMQRYASFIEHKYTDASQTTLTASDASKVADWALNGVKYAQNANIMVSTSKIDPAGNALRWELATVLMLFCQNVLNGNIK